MSGQSPVSPARKLHDADVVYLYDGSFEGFLCCVFESFAQHELPFAVWTPERETATLYPVKEIPTDHAKARRVFASFRTKLGEETESLVTRDFLSGWEDKELRLIRFLHLAFALGPGTVKRRGHPEVAPLYQMKQSLDWEVDKFQGFVRFQEHEGMLGAVIHPKNYILPLLRGHFCARFPEENFLIYDAVHQAVLLYQNHKAQLLELAEPLALPPPDEREQQFQELWKQFYKTLEIRARHNEKGRMTHCPKRFWADMTEMKEETKTGRWKYAAIVLIAALLIGLLWNHEKNGPKGEIYLYGEEHSKQSILDKELSIWGEYYEKGMRDLFVEFPYTDAQFLNLWMQADDDELLDLQFKDWEGTAGGTEVEKNFLKQIKEQYPETVFHGTDVGHTWERTGPRYLAYLEANGQKDSEEYRRAQENMEQGKRYYEIEATDEASSVRYREDRMVENFRRSYQELEAVRRTDIMGIYGSAHIVESEYLNSDFRMAKQLSENYGEHLHTKDLTQEPERIDALEVNGKTYTASYFGEQDISMVKGYKTRKFWRLEDAYEDFKELPTPREILPADNYPIKIQAGQVFAVEYLMSDGSTEWKYYITDGTVQNGQLVTKRMKME